jgi:ClpA/ClpB-like protein
MSSHLPPRPNFEFLKKRAKELLRELKKTNPRAKLADAQHALAREYGVLNWAQLKALTTTVERARVGIRNRVLADAGVAPANSLFARFTTRAKQALFFSRFEASGLGQLSIEPEHVLLGVIRARAGLENHALADARLSAEHLRADLAARTQPSTPVALFVHVPFTEGTKRALQLAAAEADRLEHQNIGTAHLLLGLLRDDESVASSMLRERGLSLDTVRRDVGELLNEEQSG